MFIYSSARFIPPVKATLPSITKIFLWSLLFCCVVKKGLAGANGLDLIPNSLNFLKYPIGSLDKEHSPSYITLTSTPSLIFSHNTSRTESHTSPCSIIKYSRKIKFFAFFNSSRRIPYFFSPLSKYVTSVFLYTGQPVFSYTYFVRDETCLSSICNSLYMFWSGSKYLPELRLICSSLFFSIREPGWSIK